MRAVFSFLLLCGFGLGSECGCSQGDSDAGSSGNHPGAGAAPSGGGQSRGMGGGSGGTESGGASSGGAGGGGGSAPEPEGSEFVHCFPWGNAPPREGPLLSVTPMASVLIVGPSAPEDLFPESPGIPFLLELSTAGAVLRSITFPNAFGPEVMAVSRDGSVFLAGQERPGTAFGTHVLPDVEDGYYIVKLSATFEVVAATMVKSFATQINALHVDAQGDLIVGTAVASFEAGSMHPVVTKYSGETLEEEWSTPFEHAVMPALIYGLTTLPNGHIVPAGLYSRTLTIGAFVLEKPPDARNDDFVYNGWVAWLAPDNGQPVLAQTFGGSVTDFALDAHVTSAGSLRLLSTHSGGTLTLFGTTVTLEEHQSAVIDLDASGTAQRVVAFGGLGTSSSKMALGQDGQTYVAGRYEDPLGDASTRGAWLLRIEPDGALGPSLRLPTGYGVSQIAVDTQGGVWISGGWGAPFEWNGEVHHPMPAGPEVTDLCRFVLRLTDF